jgi:hypothetical protein
MTATIRFTRYRVLALTGGAAAGYTLDLVRDPDLARTLYQTGGRRAAALYKGADTLVLAVELAGVDSRTVPGTKRELARRSLLRQAVDQVAGPHAGQPRRAPGAGRARRRRRRADAPLSPRRPA